MRWGFCLFFLSTLLTFNVIPNSFAEQSSSEKHRDKAVELLRKNDCPAAVRLLWPLAVKNDRKSFTILAEALPTAGLNLPGLPDDDLGWKRSYLTMGIFGFDRNSQLAGRELINMLKSGLVSQAAGNEVALCLETNEDHRECVDLAVKRKLIPSHDEFIKEVDFSDLKPDEPKCNWFQ
ncbi:MAG: hypothetical protein ABJL55_11505 [Roseibium sp.]